MSGLKPNAPQFHAMSQDEVLDFWEVDPESGLRMEEVGNRRHHFGYNRLPARDRPDLWRLLVRQWEDFMVLVLLGATAVAFFLGEHTEAVVILAIVLINGVLGFLQEYRAETALLSLAKMTTFRVKVRRDGVLRLIDSEEMVPGDIFVLAPGDRVPADGRLMGDGEGACDEAILTGESVPVGKGEATVSPDAHLSDRRNMVYHGTGVVAGTLTAVTVATGSDTELGAIAAMLKGDSEGARPPLQKNLERLGGVLLVGCLVISALIVTLGVLRGKPAYDMFLAGVSLAVPAIPEGLPAVVTIALAMGVQRMAKGRAVVRNLRSVE
ncbi:MAG: HAD-IC family P-type ATPase, partial [Bacillota bacterium]